MQESAVIRTVAPNDADALCGIYNPYIADTVITFESEPVSATAMAGRIEANLAAGLPWLVAEVQGRVLGYAYAAKWKERSAYRRTVEVTVYLSADATGQGLGTHLYQELFTELRASFHTVIAGIALPNAASVALHEKLGMKKVGHFAAVGFKFNRWIDVGYWQGFLSPQFDPP